MIIGIWKGAKVVIHIYSSFFFSGRGKKNESRRGGILELKKKSGFAAVKITLVGTC